MKLISTTVFLFLFWSFASVAQPAFSPEVRSERDLQWMKDSLHITPAQAEKLNHINLNFERNMDKANDPPDNRLKEKKQKQLMRKKDADIKVILNNERLYQTYYRREKEKRRIQAIKYTGPHQPL